MSSSGASKVIFGDENYFSGVNLHRQQGPNLQSFLTNFFLHEDPMAYIVIEELLTFNCAARGKLTPGLLKTSTSQIIWGRCISALDTGLQIYRKERIWKQILKKEKNRVYVLNF